MALAALTALFLGLALLVGWVAWSAAQSPIVIDATAMRLRLPFYGRTISHDSLDLAGARILDLDRESPSRPTLRTNGIGLPGYSVGWFKLQDGSKALLALTSRNRVLHLPTTEGYAVLLSPADPEAVLNQLRNAARGQLQSR